MTGRLKEPAAMKAKNPFGKFSALEFEFATNGRQLMLKQLKKYFATGPVRSISGKADVPFRGFGRRSHQLADGLEDRPEFLVVFFSSSWSFVPGPYARSRFHSTSHGMVRRISSFTAPRNRILRGPNLL
jgi:hypothetical protein